MTDSLRLQILDAFQGVIETAMAAESPAVPVEANRRQEVTEYPYVVIIDGGEEAITEEVSIERRFLTVTIEGYVQDADDDIRATRENLLATLSAAARNDYTLGGLCIDITRGSVDVFMIPGSHKATSAFAVDFEIEYWTAPGDPFTQAH